MRKNLNQVIGDNHHSLNAAGVLFAVGAFMVNDTMQLVQAIVVACVMIMAMILLVEFYDHFIANVAMTISSVTFGVLLFVLSALMYLYIAQNIVTQFTSIFSAVGCIIFIIVIVRVVRAIIKRIYNHHG